MDDLTPIPADTPIDSFFWTWVVPAILFAIAFAATWALYRHFSDDGESD